MIKAPITVLLILLLFTACQSKEDFSNAELIIDKFYVNDKYDNYKDIDTLMSHKFYQQTPYVEFISILKKKKLTFGNFKSKILKSYKVTNSNFNTIDLKYKIIYDKNETLESFTLEESNEGYKIFKYNID